MPIRAVPGGVALRLRVTPRGGADRVDGIGAGADGAPDLPLRFSSGRI